VRARRWNFLFATITLCSLVAGQEQATTDLNQFNHDPDAAVISATDVRLFWGAYDIWQKREHGDSVKLAAVLQQEYLDKGSQGLNDFIPNRIVSPDHLAKVVLSHRKEYEAARHYSEQMETYIPEIRKSLQALQKLYPEATFPAVYFVIGALNSGGTSSSRGLIIGSEMFGDEKQSPVQLSDVVPVVIHELVHFQQKGNDAGLLRAAMREGGADFVAELAAGRHPDEFLKAFGDSHEQEIWRRFQHDVKSNNKVGEWMYVFDPTDGAPKDLGYYMGYKICQSYYQNATDKAKAIKTIIEMASPEDILAKSAYEKRFQ
jgi:hypothetical protein